MGRHASAPEPAPDPRGALRAHVVSWLERVAFGVAAGVVTVLVLHWAGVGWRTALLVGLGALLLVPVAAWVSSTVPGHAHEPEDDRPAQRPAGPRP